MYYCSAECQKRDWKKGHKYTECNVYQLCNAIKKQDSKRKTFHDYDTPRLLLRLYLKTYYKPEKLTKEHKNFDNSRVRSLDKLMEHEQDIRNHKDRMLIYEDIKMMFEDANIKFDEKLLFRLFCKMYINGFSIMNSMLLEIGRAVYLLASQFDHSCVPNAITVFFGSSIEVRAIQEVNTEKQEIFVSYLNVMEKVEKRQEHLARGYYFKCLCERCVSELKDKEKLTAIDPIETVKPKENETEPIKDDKKDAKKNEKSPAKTDDKKQNDPKSKADQNNAKKVSKPGEKQKDEVKKADKSKENEASKKSSTDEDWHDIKKNRNQKGKKGSKPSTPEPPKEVEKPKTISESKDSKPVEPIQIIETKVAEEATAEKESKPNEPQKTDKQATLDLPDKQKGTKNQRQKSRSPQPVNRSKSPLPRNKIRNKSKSPQPPKSREQAKAGQSAPKPTGNKQPKTDKKEVKKPPTPPPVRFVPYTEIERECLDKFDELNKTFTEKVETKNWIEAYDLAKQLHKCYLTYYRDDYSSEITLHLVQMLQIKRNILREDFNLKNDEVANLYNQLQKNILVTHGKEHNLYKKDYLDITQTIESMSQKLLDQ